MDITKETVDLVKEFEGLRLEAYPDPAHGWKIPTIGYGHTSAAGDPKVYKGLKITQPEAERILAKDLRQVMDSILPLITAPVDRNQVGALVSFTFNLGEGNLKKSTLLRKLNAEDYDGAAKEFARWNKAGGNVLPGLTRRRKAEAELFQKPADASFPAPAPSTPKQPIPPARGFGWAIGELFRIILSLIPKRT